MIDNDPSNYSPEVLADLRDKAERAANDRLEVATNQNSAVGMAEVVARQAAGVFLRGWRELLGVDQANMVELDLRENQRNSDSSNPPAWNLAQLASGLQESRIFILRGEPGAGKTMTILQLADRMLADASGPIPLLFQVSGWVASGRDLMVYATDQLVGQGMTAADVGLLLRTGRFAFLLNGWNEADDNGLVRAEIQLRELLRTHPGTPLLLSTRVTQATPTIAGSTVIDVQRLTPTRKALLVQASGIARPDRLIAQIEGSTTLADITDTPLFLAAAIRLADAGGEIPTTRSGLLRRCVEALENSDEHRAMLRAAPCHDYHRRFLAELAAAMTRLGRTTLSETKAEDVIAASIRQLRDSGRLEQAGNMPAILEILIRHHMLVLPPGAAGTYAFVHEQFQERFGADWLLSRLRELTSAHPQSEILSFQQEILNSPHWRVPLVFAMEDLASNDPAQGCQLVRWMMNVDLIEAAGLAGAGGAPVWALVGAELGALLRQWYGRGTGPHRDCAIAAMIATGSADFAELLWPMLEGGDDQAAFRLLRAWDPFEMAVLGSGWAERVAQLPARIQEIILCELSRRSGRNDLAFICNLAVTGITPGVKHAALETLVYRRRYGEALAAMCSAAFGSWCAQTYALLTRIPRALLAPHVARLTATLAQETDHPVRHGIVAALRWANVPGWLDTAKSELNVVLTALRTTPPWENPAERGVNGRLRTSLEMLIAEYASMIRDDDAPWFYRWLTSDEAGDLIWEQNFIKYLPHLPEAVQVRLAESTLRGPQTGHAVEHRIRAVAENGSNQVAAVVLDAYLAAGDRRLDLRAVLGELPIAAFNAAVAARAGTAADFESRFALVNAITFRREAVKPALNQEQQTTLRQLARATVESMPADHPYKPSVYADLARFLGRIGTAEDIQLITTWAQEEIARWDAIRTAQTATHQRGARQALGQDRTWWAHFYVESLVTLGGPEAEAVLCDWLAHGEFCNDVAKGLVQLCRQEGLVPPSPPRHFATVAIAQTVSFSPAGAVRRRADAIYAAAQRPTADRQGFDLKSLGESLAFLNDPRALELLLAAPAEHAGWIVGNALHVLATFGTPLPGRAVADTLEPFIIAGENPYRNNGQDSWHGIVVALAVMLASDTPSLAIERMRRLPASRRENSDARDLFEILSACPKLEAGAYLVELSQTLPPTARSWPDLIEALSYRDGPVCRTRLLELTLSPVANAALAHGGSLLDALVRIAQSDPSFATTLLRQLGDQGALAHADVVHAICDLDPEAAMLALLDYGNLSQIEETLQAMVRGVTLSERPMPSGSAHYIVPRAANGVRRKLAMLLVSGTREHRTIAARLLVAIQLQRLEYGQAMDEPLHPDATLIPQLGCPWSLME